MAENNLVIFDCDVGSDDAWGLLMLLKADKLKKIKLIGITCVAGNTSVDNVYSNVCRLLQAANRVEVPVFKGVNNSILPNKKPPEELMFHGRNGFGDIEFDKTCENHPNAQKKHAVTAMYELACQYPKQISFVLVGPLTNFAMCLRMYSDFHEKIKDVFIMGGNIRAVGNTTSAAEFNFYSDPEAAKIVLETSKSPIFILPWEACVPTDWDITLDWRFNHPGSVDSLPVKILNAVEKAQYYSKGFTDWVPCDAILVALFLFSHHLIKKETTWNASVELNGELTRGQMVLDHLKEKLKIQNINIIEEVDDQFFKKICLWTVGHKDYENESFNNLLTIKTKL